MSALVAREKTALQGIGGDLTLRRPVRDVSLADFNWVVQKSIYANPIFTTRHRDAVANGAGAGRSERA